MADVSIYFYEFLVRGNPDGTLDWHIIRAATGTDAFGRPFRDEQILNATQAEEAGITIPEILSDFNSKMAIELESVRAELAKYNENSS